jgi:hypothetical protein
MGDKFIEAFRVEFSQKPVARFAQHRLAAKLEQLEVQQCTFEWCRHVGSALGIDMIDRPYHTVGEGDGKRLVIPRAAVRCKPMSGGRLSLSIDAQRISR